MLEIRPNCEHCGKDLPYNSVEAMICSFECTYCKNCATKVFNNICPSCGGGFEKRPVRPSEKLGKYPASEKRVFNPKDLEKFEGLRQKYKNIPSEKR
ncbi:DUF1272 domain-containing protein [Tenacibaculum sp. IB213877]|uniref:DUF1272 domain-containing protein n=1 Tax=Tenacibaculum sp. IB213877 TaxID=3097351 RepID=UPI002A59D7C8|nr:DUF1272 domain-containing protein [Tenacibaculum sp. IB213877]MDY0779805.1 DUF1272 domain-containing protein [Tenacibaculum sp. IB213877]